MPHSLKQRLSDSSQMSATPLRPAKLNPVLVSDYQYSSIDYAAYGQRISTALHAAEHAYDLSGRYSDELGTAVCGDPGWNILLDLFISLGRRRKLSVSAVCIGSRVASATALRYIALLQEAGLVKRIADATDGRRSYIMLTGTGFKKMMELLDPIGAEAFPASS